MLQKHQHHAGAQQHADSGADLGPALDYLAVAPVAQDRAKQAMVFQPGTQARRAAGGGPGGEEDEFGGGQAGNNDGHQTDAQADVGQQAEEQAREF
ncbi:hypothetical protein D3C85_1091910 [compost metagenome]